MPNKKISQLDQITSVAGTEVVPVVQGGVVKRTTTGAFTGRLKELARAANATAIQDAKEVGRSTLIDGLSAGAVMQQDLKAVSSALHRSPNAVTAMFVYDTSKDSDGGAWTKRCQHTSWYNEPLSGNWLGAHTNETSARNHKATLGADRITNGTFSTDLAGWTSIGTVTSSATGGVLNISGVNGDGVYQNFAVEAGKTYELRITFLNKTAAAQALIYNDAYPGGAPLVDSGNNTTLGEYVVSFVAATTGTFHARIWMRGTGSAQADNISVKEVVAINTTSNDYYQLISDGKFYRLWKNLLARSSEFDSGSWSKSNAIVVPNSATAPDGAMSASTISSASSWEVRQNITFTGTGRFSVYVKKNVGSQITLFCVSQVAYRATFDFDTLTFSGVGGSIASTSYESVGNGWYRISVTGTGLALGSANGPGISASAGTSVYAYGAQFEYGSTTSPYEVKTTIGTTSEIFRGNKAEFPSLVGIVAEAYSITLYDLTESGRPMWMRFITAGDVLYMIPSNIVTLAACDSKLAIGGAYGANEWKNGGVRVISFARDMGERYTDNAGRYSQNIAGRNISGGWSGSAQNTAVVYRVAISTLSDAPIDYITGLKTPTIVAATAAGITVFKHDGTTVSSSSTISYNSVYITSQILTASRTADSTLYYALNPGKLANNFTLLTEAAGAVDFNQGNTTALALENRSEFARSSGAKLQLLKHNETTAAKGAAATITPTYNTGYMVGDIKRSYLTSVAPGTVTSTAFAARSLFLDDTTKGIWLDPSDMDTMYQNINGSAVTGVEQLVGLVLDKSKGLPRGPELVTNGSFEFSTTGWNSSGSYPATITIVNNAARITATGAWGRYIQTISGLTVGKLYAVSAYARVVSGGSFASIELTESSGATGSYGGILGSTSSSSFTKIGFCFRATLATHYISIGDATSTLNVTEFDNISVREIIAGNHAYAPSDAARPTLSARYNLLTKTEQFDDATGWDKTNVTVTANASIAPDGNTSADKIIAAATSSSHLLSTAVGTGLYTFSFYAKAAEYSAVSVSNGPDNYVHFNLASGSVSSLGTGWAGATITNVGNGWWLCSATNAASKSWGNARIYLNNAWQNDGNASGGVSFVGDGTSGVYVWGASLVPADQAGLPYQRVNTATDYDSDATKFPRYLKFSGAQSLQTNSIDFSYTDKMFAAAGVRKLSDYTTQSNAMVIAELSAQVGINNGSWAIVGSIGYSTGTKYEFDSYGTASASAITTSASYAAPTTNIVTGVSDLNGSPNDYAILRINGTQIAEITTTQGNGPFGTYPIYIGARAGSSFWFNGQLSQLLIAGRAVTDKQIQDAENYIEQKTYGTYPEFLVDASGNQVVDALGNPLYANVTYQY